MQQTEYCHIQTPLQKQYVVPVLYQILIINVVSYKSLDSGYILMQCIHCRNARSKHLSDLCINTYRTLHTDELIPNSHINQISIEYKNDDTLSFNYQYCSRD